MPSSAGKHKALVLGVGAGAAETLDGGVDQPGIQPRERVPAEAEPLEGTGAEVLHDHVGVIGHLQEERAATLGLEIEGHTLLVRVEEQEEPRVLAALVGERVATGLAGGRLDLDDLGAEPRNALSDKRG